MITQDTLGQIATAEQFIQEAMQALWDIDPLCPIALNDKLTAAYDELMITSGRLNKLLENEIVETPENLLK